MSECRYGSGSTIYEQDLKRLLSEDCIIEPGASIVLFYDDRVKAEDFGSGVVVQSPKRESVMKELEASGAQQVTPPIEHTAQAPAAKIAASTEATAIDVTALTQMTGGNGSIAIVLALIAVLFGTAGWKFWSKLSEQKHELRMKELEMQSNANRDKSPQQCATVHAQHEARLAALEGKVSTVEQSSINLDGDFDPADIKKRIVKLEKKLARKDANNE